MLAEAYNYALLAVLVACVSICMGWDVGYFVVFVDYFVEGYSVDLDNAYEGITAVD